MMPPSPVNPATFRDRRNFALARWSELAAPLLKGAASVSCRGRPTPPVSWRRGVLIGADHIGDVLYNTASLPALAEAFPECQWHFLATPPATEVLANNPFIKSCVESLDALSPVDVAICYNSGGYWRDLFGAIRQRIPNRVGYIHKGFSALVTHPVRINYPQPYPAYFRDLVAQLIGKPPTWSLRPRIYASPRDVAKADAIWVEAGLGAKPVIACFLTSRQAAGVWPARMFAETVARLEATGLCQTILLGTTQDAELLQSLKEEFGLVAMTLAGRLDLLALACFLRRCAVVLCPDSGPRHLANAVETPVVFVRNLAVRKIETGAYCATEFDVAPDRECLDGVDLNASLTELTPAMVAAAIISRL